MYFHEGVGKYKNKLANPQQLVMVDHQSGRVWAQRVPNKGVIDDAAWFPIRFLQDTDNCGYGDIRIQFESDQQSAIVAFQTAMQ